MPNICKYVYGDGEHKFTTLKAYADYHNINRLQAAEEAVVEAIPYVKIKSTGKYIPNPLFKHERRLVEEYYKDSVNECRKELTIWDLEPEYYIERSESEWVIKDL